VLQHRNIVTSMYVIYFSRNKTKINGHKLFLFEIYSSTGRKTPIFHHSFPSRLMCFLPGWYYPFMSAGLTCKMATLTKNYPFWTNVIFPRNPSVFWSRGIYINKMAIINKFIISVQFILWKSRAKKWVLLVVCSYKLCIRPFEVFNFQTYPSPHFWTVLLSHCEIPQKR
jgi:hypothetical protein